ncbi:MAG: DUF1177 domain-containing protein [Candidatus Bathyarchaeia archaeon]
MLKQVIEAYELLDSAKVTGYDVSKILKEMGLDRVDVRTIKGEIGSTDFLKVRIPGLQGKSVGGVAPTLGVIGRLGGIGARPGMVGIVSDADGAVTAISVAMKLASMRGKGDALKGDVIVATHVCPNAPTRPHRPVPFMGSPVDMATMNRYEVDPGMDAILSIDTTKGNRIVKFKGFAITPTAKEGYILRVSDSLLDIMEIVTGTIPRVVPITTQDITPYGNGLDHINSIMQPATVTDSPVVGVAITTDIPVPGCATGASHIVDIELAARFVVEVAKAFGEGRCKFYDEEEFHRIIKLYGSMKALQTLGKNT